MWEWIPKLYILGVKQIHLGNSLPRFQWDKKKGPKTFDALGVIIDKNSQRFSVLYIKMLWNLVNFSANM